MTDPVSAERCAWCGGSGRITRGSAICPECNGTGTRPRPMPPTDEALSVEALAQWYHAWMGRHGGSHAKWVRYENCVHGDVDQQAAAALVAHLRGPR